MDQAYIEITNADEFKAVVVRWVRTHETQGRFSAGVTDEIDRLFNVRQVALGTYVYRVADKLTPESELALDAALCAVKVPQKDD